MRANKSYIRFEQTNAFSSIANAYKNQAEILQPFFTHHTDMNGVMNSIAARKNFPTNRTLLVNHLTQTYTGISASNAVESNIHKLQFDNTFTITTAHQPNLLTGPLYFIYKIAHAIALCNQLNAAMPQNHFVPVYYMGSEDADFDELNHLTIDEKKYEWKTNQSGAFGRMMIDKHAAALLQELSGQLSVLEFGNEVMDCINNAYSAGTTIQEATLKIVNNIFGAYGLLVCLPDAPSIKNQFASIIKKELQEGFSSKAVKETIDELQKHFKVQASGRAINLFYLKDNRRDRIEKFENIYRIVNTEITFTDVEIIDELSNHPERFSPNVILRGVLQEMILPNIIFIGGGGEIAYWLELKKVFEEAAVPYPMLLLRNSFMLMNEKQQAIKSKLSLSDEQMFYTPDALAKNWVYEDAATVQRIQIDIKNLTAFYGDIESKVAATDKTLIAHVASLRTKAENKINQLEKKLLRAEKKKYEDAFRQVKQFKAGLFPGNNLQERVENIWGFYGRYGSTLIDTIIAASPGLDASFCLLSFVH